MQRRDICLPLEQKPATTNSGEPCGKEKSQNFICIVVGTAYKTLGHDHKVINE